MGKRKMDSELHRIKLEAGTVYQTSKVGNYYFRYQVKPENISNKDKWLCSR